MARRVLRELYPTLLESLPGKELANHLYSNDLLTEKEFQEISIKQILCEQNEVMIKALQQRGSHDVIDRLIQCLESVGSCSSIIKQIQEKHEQIVLGRTSSSVSCKFILRFKIFYMSI